MTKRIRLYESFRNKRRSLETINETVVQRDSTFIVGGIKVDSKTLKAYIKKVKDDTGKDISNMYSNMEIAEELVKWSVDSLDNIENIPVSALLGGDEGMSEEAVEDDTVSEFDEDGELDLDTDDGLGLDDDDDLDLDDDDDLDLDDEDDLDLDDEDLDLDDDDLDDDDLDDEDLDLDSTNDDLTFDDVDSEDEEDEEDGFEDL